MKESSQKDILINIMNNMDAYLYVSDLQTDELLFINENFRKHFNIPEHISGVTCWEVFQDSFTERCPFCPVPKLLENPSKPIVWEELNTVTGRYYKNTDSIIEWKDGKKVHLQHSVDITDLKLTEISLKKRLRQQELMTFISQGFSESENIHEFINQALKMSGEFMNTDHAYIAVYDKHQDSLDCIHEWHDENETSYLNSVSNWPLTTDMQIYKDLTSLGYVAINGLNQDTFPDFNIIKDLEIGAFLNISIMISGKFWGVLGFSINKNSYEWTQSDIQLSKLIAGEFSREFSRSITDEQLVVAKELAEQSSQAKSEFLSRMSHEIRTPINVIIGMTSIAKSATTISKNKYCLEKIEDASKHLLNVINDILDMSKIESGKFELSFEEFSFEKMIMETVDIVGFHANEKNQDLIVNVDKNVPHRIIADEPHIIQVLNNLLSNAIKFTQNNGVIKLNIRKTEESDTKCTLLFEVIDNGIGIPPEQQTRLFKSFEQFDGSISRKYGGTGLGLAITKQIIEMMNGYIWIESELEKGSKFSFVIDVKKCDEQDDYKNINHISDKVNILAVDDSPEVRDYLYYLMKELKLPCDIAKDGFEALSFIENNKNEPYNIYLIDWQMAVMDGIELTRRIKKITDDNAIVIMISVHQWGDIEADAVKAGVSRFIPKPIFPSMLVDCINECLSDTSNKQKVVPTKPTDVKKYVFKNHVILLTEDIEVNREIVMSLLEDTELIIDVAQNGLEAYNMFKNNPDRYSLIFMDIHMNVMDGYESTKKIRALDFETAKTVPIIAMTADVFKEDIEMCINAGMTDHLGKPINVRELFMKLDKYLEPKDEPMNTKKEVAELSPMNYSDYLPYVDVENGLKRLMNNKKLYFTLLKSFMNGTTGKELVEHMRINDSQKIAQTAHALKGASANLGLTNLFEISADIEALAKASSETESLLPDLKNSLDKTTTSIVSILEKEKIN